MNIDNKTEDELEKEFDRLYDRFYDTAPPEESLEYYEITQLLMSASNREGIEILEDYLQS